MDPNQVLVAITGLLSALVGGGIAFWGQAWHWRKDRKAQAGDEQSRAVHQLLVKANSIDLRAHELAVAAQSRASLDGTVFALLGSDGPIDVNATIQALHADAEELSSAATQLWLTSDPRTVELARAIADAAGDVVAARTTRPRAGLFGWLLNLLRGPELGDPALIEAARSKLADRTENLVRHARRLSEVAELEPRSSAAAAVSARD